MPHWLKKLNCIIGFDISNEQSTQQMPIELEQFFRECQVETQF